MYEIKCRGAYVRFNGQNLQQQRIRFSDITTADFLIVQRNTLEIIVKYCRSFEDKTMVLKELVFNRANVVELEIEETMDAYHL